MLGSSSYSLAGRWQDRCMQYQHCLPVSFPLSLHAGCTMKLSRCAVNCARRHQVFISESQSLHFTSLIQHHCLYMRFQQNHFLLTVITVLTFGNYFARRYGSVKILFLGQLVCRNLQTVPENKNRRDSLVGICLLCNSCSLVLLARYTYLKILTVYNSLATKTLKLTAHVRGQKVSFSFQHFIFLKNFSELNHLSLACNTPLLLPLIRTVQELSSSYSSMPPEESALQV